MDYSKTVNLPTTDFPMKANLPQREPEILKKWEAENTYEFIQNSRNADKLYILHDGPPYANGHIHIGHALNKILKDIIIKHKTMMGFKAPYVPGWDCHGLPIELQVTKKLGDKAKDMSKAEIRKLCRVYAQEFINIQMEEFKQLGVLGNFKNPYKTMTNDYESTIVKKLGMLYKEGFIFKGKKPIYWCPTCETALAEAEVEYNDHTSTSIYVKFKVDAASLNAVKGVDKDNTYVVIWTTTPWTLPANLAVCFHPDFEYSAYKFGKEYFILADGLAENFASETGLNKGESIKLKISEIEALSVNHPFIDRKSVVVFGKHVTLEQGTGIVHTAPGHGAEDYIVGLENGLDIFCPVDHAGKYTDDYPEMKGVHVFKANQLVVDKIKQDGTLIQQKEISHSYPHCWRCKKPLIFRATEQWFFGVDKNNLRSEALKAVDSTKWIPKWGESRFRAMIESRPDWCLSRQRSWGVPIPSFFCKKCGKNNMNEKSVLFFAEYARKNSIDDWYTEDITKLIPADTKCECGSNDFSKEYDILDVWFDSGVSHFAVLDNWPELRWPADLYLEGSDQHRGWFQSSLWPSIALRQRAPFDTVLTHGFVLDDKGKAMSKSVGNVVAPEKIISQYGADILRMWVSSEDYRNDLKISYDMMKQISDSYRKIRNTFKFLIGNLSDFDASKDMVEYSNLTDLDKWMLDRLYDLNEQILAAYDNFEFHLVYRKIQNFCAVELSAIYFDISKDILYIEKADSKNRRSNQTVIYEICETMLRLCAPILAFTTEEIWMFNGRKGTVHAEKYHILNPQYKNESIQEKMNNLVVIKQDVMKALEVTRKEGKVGKSVEAEIRIYVKSDSIRTQLKDSGSEIARFFQVSKVTVCESEESSMVKYDFSSVSADKAEGVKCPRCWNVYDSKEIGTDLSHPELCRRCTEAIK